MRPSPPSSRSSESSRCHARRRLGGAIVCGALLAASLAASGCSRAAAWDLGNPPGRGDTILCADESRPAERRDDGVAVCPWGAAFDGKSIGRVDEAGRYTAELRIRASPFHMNLCETVAFAGYPSGEILSPAVVSWSARPGDVASGWGPTVPLMIGRGYLDCELERLYFTVRDDCFVIGRDGERQPMECLPEVFASLHEWSILPRQGDAQRVTATPAD